MKKAIILFISIFTAIMVKAQEYKELDNASYKINLEDFDPKNPIPFFYDSIYVSKLNPKTKKYKKVRLNKGNYQIKSQKNSETFRFTVNENQFLKDTLFVQSKKGGIKYAVKNSRIEGFIMKRGNNSIRAVINRKDSILNGLGFSDGELLIESKIMLTKKHFNKSIITRFKKDGSYTETDKVNETYIQYDKNGNIIAKDSYKSGIEKVQNTVREPK